MSSMTCSARDKSMLDGGHRKPGLSPTMAFSRCEIAVSYCSRAGVDPLSSIAKILSHLKHYHTQSHPSLQRRVLATGFIVCAKPRARSHSTTVGLCSIPPPDLATSAGSKYRCSIFQSLHRRHAVGKPVIDNLRTGLGRNAGNLGTTGSSQMA
jgi:hypothetical protein